MNIIQSIPQGTITSESEVAIDFEVFGMGDRLHRPSGQFASMQVAVDDSVYIITREQDVQATWDAIKHAKHIIGHNLLFDLRQLKRWATIQERPVWDTMICEQVLFGGYYGIGEFALADLVRRYLDVYMDKTVRDEFITGSYLSKQMMQYAAEDAHLTLQVYHKQQEEIAKRGYDMRVYWEADEPSIWTILDMKPVKVNVKRWLEMAEEFEIRGREIEDEIGVNTNSSKQVIEYVRRVSGRVIPNAQAETLEKLVEKIPAVAQILEAKRYRKASSTYGVEWVRKYVEDGDLVYSDWRVNGSETGRWSSSAPNLQNLPARKIPEYRELFVHTKGRMIVADVQAQEPRCLAALSNDKNMKLVFENKEDIHLSVTRAIYGDDTIQKSDPRRDIGKMINLATSYGMSAREMAKRINITEDEAEKFLRAYFNRFPDVENFIARQRMIAQKKGYVESVMGRRVWMNEHSYQINNTAINAPIQSSAADFTKVWTNTFRTYCGRMDLEFPVCLVIHDELVLDIPKEKESDYRIALDTAFKDTANKLFPSVPFQYEVFAGKSWAAKKGEEE